MPIIPEWQDRRGMFQRGREMHEPSSASQRPASESSMTGSVGDVLSKTTTNQSSASSTNASPALDYNPNYGSQHRRRSSAASNSNTSMFANLHSYKRGSEDYSTRRSNHAEMEGKSPGIVGGIWNSTFRGMAKTKDVAVEKAAEAKKGIME